MRIYLFNNTVAPSDWNYCIAMTEEGEFLASHICSHIAYMSMDLYYNRPERIEEWEKRFGEVEIIELEQGKVPPKEVLEKNRLRKINANCLLN